MKRILLLLAGFCLPALVCPAQVSVLGADAFGRGNSLVAVPGYSSIYQNPAGIAREPVGFLAFNYLRILPVEGFHTVGLQGVFVRKHFNYGFSMDSFGDRHYRETRAGVAMARAQDRVALGMKLSYLGFSGGGTRSAVVGEAGMIVRVLPYLQLGTRIRYGNTYPEAGGATVPAVLTFGAGLSPNAKVNLSGQVDYWSKRSAEIRLGLHYRPRDQLGFSAGAYPAGRSLHFGTDVVIGRYGLIYSIATHPYAGIAQHTTLIYKLHD